MRELADAVRAVAPADSPADEYEQAANVAATIAARHRPEHDAALFMNVISRPDARDFMSLPFEGRDFAAGLHELEPRRLKIGLLADMGVGLPVQRDVRAAVDAAATALAGAGCRVESVRSFLTSEMLDCNASHQRY